MKEQLILIIAAYRFNNLISVLRNIDRYYEKYSQKFDIYIVICKDKLNNIGSFDAAYEFLNNSSMNWLALESGHIKRTEQNTGNYGGDIMNEPLKFAVDEYFKLNNPWVYILDDDNIIHHDFFDMFLYVLDMMKVNEDYKDILIMNMALQDGLIKEIYPYALVDEHLNSHWSGWSEMADPSQVIIKYDIIKKYGYYGGGFLYDFEWLNKQLLYNEKQNDNIFYYTNLPNHIVSCYHNGLHDTKELEQYVNSNIEDINIDLHIQNTKLNTDRHLFSVLSDVSKKKILDIIKNEVNEINYK